MKTRLFLKTICSLLLLLMFSVDGWAQVTIFTESMGTVSSTTSIAAHETANGFDNDGFTMTNGGATNPADIRATSPSSGYSGASGSANIWFTSTNAQYGFGIEGIDASSYISLSIQFGYRKESSSALPNLAIDYWNGTSYVNVPFTFNEAANASTGWYLSPVVSLPVGAQISNLKLRLVKSGTIAVRVDDITLKGTVGSIPTLSVDPSSLTGFEYYFGLGPSDSQSFTVTGTNLTNNVFVTAPTNYEISDGGSYTGSIEIIPSSGSVNQMIDVRLISGLAANDYNNEDITITSSGATSKTVTCSGSVLAIVPSITLSETSLTGFTYIIGAGPSTEKSFTVTGANLTDDIELTPPTNYEISTGSGLSFVAQNPLVLTESGGSVAETTIYVRLIAGLAIGTYNSETISATSTGADTETLTLNGSVTAPAPSAQVLLRPSYIDLSSTTSESAVLMKLENYPQDDARFRLFNGSNQYNSWNEATDAYVTSTSYSNGPMVPGTPSTSSTFWIVFQRGNNNSNAASYRDRLGSAYSANYQTVALPLATSISTSFTLTGKFVGSGIYDNSEKYVVLAYSGSSLISAASTTLNSGTFAVVFPDGETIDKLEIRAVDNTLIEELTGSWSITTNVGNFPCPINLTVDNVDVYDYELPYSWENTLYWAAGTYYKYFQTSLGCDSTLQLNLSVQNSGTIWVNKNIGSAVQANWSPVAGATMYQLRYSLDGMQTWTNHITSQTRFRIVNLTPATVYDLEVQYFDGTNWSGWAAYAPVEFETEVVEFQFTRDIGTKVIVEWTALPDVSSYILQYKKSSDLNWINSGEYTANTTTVNYPVEDNTDYDFRVIVRYQGTSLWWTAPQTLTTLNMEYWFTKDIGTRAILNFTPIPGAVKYILYWKESTAGTWKTATANNASTTLNGLSSSTQYDFKVNVYFDNSVWGTTANKSQTTNKINIAVSNYTGTEATFIWDPVVNPDASAFYLQTREVGATTWASKYVIANTTTVSGLDDTKTYEYRLIVRYGSPEISWGATEIYVLTGAKETSVAQKTTLNVYPNPVSDVLTISVNSSENGLHIWKLYDMNGKIIAEGIHELSTGTNTCMIDMLKLSAGIYVFHSNILGSLETVFINKF